uniref:Olfactory receptor family 6 subfamily M member 1 n=1 Tax=Monodon monoceros TaxID=40151 RepID=A0A8C6C951_MONMO
LGNCLAVQWLGLSFTLTAFPALLKLRISLFVALLLAYTLTAMENIIIISLMWADNRLQTPMYFFLSNLSFLDILYTTVVTPKLLACLLGEKKNMSFAGCITQTYFYFFLGTVEFILLAVMSFDCYVAICNPLRYTIIMNSRACLLMILGCWLGAFLPVLVPTIVVACIDTRLTEKVNFLLSALVILSSLAFTTGSYIYIISTILHIPSAQGHQKAFSTCASHITIVSIAYGSNIFVYVRLSQNHSLDFDKVATVLITIVTPLLNPFIYSLRNEKVKEVLREAMNRITSLVLRKT